MKPKFAAGMMRVKGFLEMAAALTESRVPDMGSSRLTVAITGIDQRTKEPVRLSFLSDRAGPSIKKVATKEVDVGWVNPSAALAMAVRGKGQFSEPLPLRALAVFPSWDVIFFVVRQDTGITSLDDILRKKYPLKVSTSGGTMDATIIFALTEILRAYGFSLDDMVRWGGSVQSLPRPGHPDRIADMKSGAVNAVFDEGVKLWGREAAATGMRFLPVRESVLAHMESLGFRRTLATRSMFPGLKEDIMAVDFGGWPIFVHEGMSDSMAYAICEAIDARKEAIPVDQTEPLTTHQLCHSTEGGPIDFPLHPGAERYYREKGYLP